MWVKSYFRLSLFHIFFHSELFDITIYLWFIAFRLNVEFIICGQFKHPKNIFSRVISYFFISSTTEFSFDIGLEITTHLKIIISRKKISSSWLNFSFAFVNFRFFFHFRSLSTLWFAHSITDSRSTDPILGNLEFICNETNTKIHFNLFLFHFFVIDKLRNLHKQFQN